MQENSGISLLKKLNSFSLSKVFHLIHQLDNLHSKWENLWFFLRNERDEGTAHISILMCIPTIRTREDLIPGIKRTVDDFTSWGLKVRKLQD